MKRVLNIILSPLHWLRDAIIRGLLKLRAKGQIESMRMAIAEADRIKKATGRKVLVVYNKTNQQWECIQKQAMKDAHKLRKLVNANNRRKRGRNKINPTDNKGLSLERVKQIEKKQVYAT